MDGIEMRLDVSLSGQQTQNISYRQIAVVRLLQLSGQELEQTIVRERVDNAALDAEVHVCCPRCNTVLANIPAFIPLDLSRGMKAGPLGRRREDWQLPESAKRVE